jgi:hypothetical protein
MLTLPEIRPDAANQIFGALKSERLDTGGVQIHDAPVEIEELDAVAAPFDQVASELLERWVFHNH